jgi:PAS domain S-box-containing protein
MRDEDKSKEQLIKELRELRRQAGKAPRRDYPLFVHTGESSPPASGAEEGNKIRVAGINIEWAPKLGTCTFANLPVAMMWVDTTLAGLMSGVQAMVGTERFLLALQSQGRKSVDTDWQVISRFPNFPEGFRAIANIAGVAGWGTWELTSLDLEKRECRFRVSESWEGLYQKALGVSWGSGMLAGKMAGYCTRLFGTDCWADQTAFIAKGDPYDEFSVRPSSRSLEQEIENLLASDEATRADMAVTMRKLEEEVAERQRAEEVLREYHQKLEALIHASPLSIFVLDPEGKVLLWNPASESTFGWSAEEVLGRVLPIVPEDKEEEFWNNLRRGLAGDSLKGVELRRRKKDGAPIDINVYTSPLYDSQGQVTGLMVVDADVTERKRADELIKLNESRLEALLQLNQMTDASLSEITNFAMEEAIRLTGSKIGYIAFMNEDETVLTMHAWSRAAMSECRIADKPRKYPVETTGLWGEAVRQRRPIITNDYGAANPWKKGYPEGHVHIVRHLNVPIFESQKIVIVAGVGNKPADYDESDVRQLTLLMEGMWRMLQRNQAEAELEQSISLLKATLESTADGLLVVDNFGKIVAYNQKFAQMWRIPESVLAARDDDRALAFVLEQLRDQKAFVRKVQELYDERESESFDLIEFKDGRVFERFSQPQRIGETIVGRVWSFRDVTERKQAEEGLQESEEKYRKLMETAHDAIFIADADTGVILEANCKAQELLGLPREKIIGLHQSQVHPPEEAERYKRIFREHSVKGGVISEDIYVADSRGRRIPVEIGASVIEVKGKKLIYGIFRNLTAQRQAEDALRRSEEKYRLLVNQIPAVVFEGYPDWSVDFFDNKVEALTGYGKEDFDSRRCKWSDVVLPEDLDYAKTILRDALKAEGAFVREHRIRRKDGEIRWIQCRGQILYDASGKIDSIRGVTFDITPSKQAEEALRESEEKYRLLVNQIPAVVFKGYPDWSVDFFDNKIETLAGYGKEDFDSRRLKWSDLILPDDFEEIQRQSREAVNARSGAYEREYRIRKKDGGIAWVQAMGQRFYDAAGQLDYTSGVFFDITRRKRAEEALLNYEFIANTAKDCMTLIDRNYVYVAANAAYCRAHDKPLEEMAGASVAQIWGEDSFNNVIRGYLDQCFAGRAVEFEGWFEFGRNGMGCYHVFYSPYFDASGKVVYAAVVSRDITERKKVEEALRQSEMKYRQLVDQIPAVVYKGYTDWTMDCFDEKVKAITGYSQEDFTSRRKSWLDLIFPEDVDQAKNLFREALKGDGFYVTEHRIRNKNGVVRWIQARNRIIRDVAGKVDHISGVFFDLTERKELEDQLNKAQRMEAIGILAGGLAHDFNNLLTAIMGYGEIMSLGLRKEDPFYLYVEEISKAANRGAALTDQLLAFSRKQILQPRVVNLNEVVLDMDQMLRRLIGEDIELATVIGRDLGLVKADPGQIEQIIMNLAVNARDAMPEGGKLTVETANIMLDDAYARSHVDVTPGPYVMLAVSDNGVGMNADTMSRIFEPFFTTKESGKGTGLGLATAYGIVKQSGGHIWVYSEPEQGTTFKIYLPRVKEAPVAEKPKAAAPASLEGKETILVVEDDAALRELIGTALRKYGFKVLEAPHGGEALLICEKQKDPIHLMLTDVVMPQISGTALAERLKGLHPEMKVLYMSGYTENAIVHHGVLDARVNFIPKPFRVLALVEKVREVLDAPEPDNNHS